MVFTFFLYAFIKVSLQFLACLYRYASFSSLFTEVKLMMSIPSLFCAESDHRLPSAACTLFGDVPKKTVDIGDPTLIMKFGNRHIFILVKDFFAE